LPLRIRRWPLWLVAGHLGWLCAIDVPLVIAATAHPVFSFADTPTPQALLWVNRLVAAAALCWGFAMGRQRRWRHSTLLPVVGTRLAVAGQVLTIVVASHALGDLVVFVPVDILCWSLVTALLWLGAALGYFLTRNRPPPW
jgi:hypothetical protein